MHDHTLLTGGAIWIGLIKSWWTWPGAGTCRLYNYDCRPEIRICTNYYSRKFSNQDVSYTCVTANDYR